MRIGLYARYAAQEQRTGLGEAAYHLIEGLLARNDGSKYFVYCDQTPGPALLSSTATIRSPWFPVRREFAVREFAIPALARRDRIDLLHSMSGELPWRATCPTVATIPDLSVFEYPGLKALRDEQNWRRMLTRAVRTADWLTTLSDTTRSAIISRFGRSGDTITTVACGLDPRYLKPVTQEARDEVWRMLRFVPGTVYILAVGTIESRKNLSTLVRALGLVRSSCECDCRLVLAGPPGNDVETILGQARGLGVRASVVLPGFVPAELMPALYACATLLAFPSLQEGFGLPVLEAMALGTPTVVSDIDVLNEVAGDAAIAVPATEASEWARAIHRLLADHSLRARCVSQGRRRAADFSWSRAADETVVVYEKLLNREGKSRSASLA